MSFAQDEPVGAAGRPVVSDRLDDAKRAMAGADGETFAAAEPVVADRASVGERSIGSEHRKNRFRRPVASKPTYDLHRKALPGTLRRMASTERRSSQLLRGVLDLCLLAVIADDPAYGYEMTKRLRARGLSIVGEGSIYPLLGRLERDGLVETHRAASNGGPPRKYYRASNAGRRALAEGIAEWTSARDGIDVVLGLVEAEVQT